MRTSLPRTIIAFAAICLVARLDAAAQIMSARVTGGNVEGERRDGISSFKGIPFAAPPVAALRWKAPQPVQSWEGVKKATAFAPSPMQNGFVAAFMGVPQNFSEDCLYLNVWTAATNANQKLPVMVWIYGGAFAFGSTAVPVYDGAQLAQKGVIVVSVAYRLGPFGFLAHSELTREGGKGNFGLRDQIAGLQWVHDNIAAFGGDTSQVTIFGESAGSISVSLLVSSPRAKGLFQRAIGESGAAFIPTKQSPDAFGLIGPLEVAEKEGQKFISALGVKDIAEARALPARKIQDAKFSPEACYDNDLLPGEPQGLYAKHTFNDTPILIGFNSDDGGMFVPGNKQPDEFVSDVRRFCGDYADKIVPLYPHTNSETALRSAKELVRDGFFAWPTWYWARLQAEHGSGKAFVYYYDHRTAESPNGAGHGAELGYVFHNLEKPEPEDAKMSDLISSYWVNFAKTGNPNRTGLPEWKAFTTADPKVMILDDAKPRMAPLPNLNRLEVLDGWLSPPAQRAETRNSRTETRSKSE